MINVLDRVRRFQFPGGVAMCLIRAVALLAISNVQISAHKKPVLDYLPSGGPMPLRFENERTDLKGFAFPPLDMGIRTKESPTNLPPILSNTNHVLPVLIKLPNTNQVAKVMTNAPVVSVDASATNSSVSTTQTLDSASQLLSSPLPSNDNVFTPQMFVHFFQKNGTNRGPSVSLPVDVPRTEPTSKSSSATYVSP